MGGGGCGGGEVHPQTCFSKAQNECCRSQNINCEYRKYKYKNIII